jgi:peptidoglycan hydrolase-like protein with peptidoglycan-binding domain
MLFEEMPDWPLVRRGDDRHPVKSLQRLLRAHGADLEADGIFGPITDAAVRAFQSANGLAVDGIVGPMTWPVLIIEVRRGDEGEAVMAVQEEINFRNLSDGEGPARLVVDGIFGPLTDEAVRRHQRGVELAADGIVGPLTWRFFITGFLSG